MTEDRQKGSDTPVRWQQLRSRSGWVELALFLAGSTLVIFYTPFAHLFGFESFEARHGGFFLDDGIYVVIWSVGKSLYRYFFRRERDAAEFAALKGAFAL